MWLAGTVYVGSHETLYALAADDGAEKWSFRLDDTMWKTSPVALSTPGHSPR